MAILSDIHGNAAALKAVCREAAALDVERYVILGDLVGYYPHVAEVWRILQDLPHEAVRGNHEDMLERARQPNAAAPAQPEYAYGLRIALETLPDEALEAWCGLPRKRELEADGKRLLLCHGAPWDTDAYVYPDSRPETLARCAAEGFDYVFMGHTHYSFIHRAGSTLVVNPGSVGQNRETGGIASWGLLDTQRDIYRQRATPYDTAALIAELLASAAPAYLTDVLSRGRR